MHDILSVLLQADTRMQHRQVQDHPSCIVYYAMHKNKPLPFCAQDGLFINKPVYDHRSLDSLVHHAFYAAKHLGAAQLLALKAAEYVQMKRRPNQHAGNLQLYQDRMDALLTQ